MANLVFVEVVSVEQYSFSLFLVAGNCRERNKKSKAHRKLTGDGELVVRRGCQRGATQLFAVCFVARKRSRLCFACSTLFTILGVLYHNFCPFAIGKYIFFEKTDFF